MSGLTRVLAAVLLCATSAGAQPRRAAPDDEARRLFFDGAQFFQEGDYESALAAWRSSYEVRPAAVVKYNIALALRELFRYSEAVTALREYLSESPTLSAARRAEIGRAIASLEARIAPVTIEVEPAGASIRIDGRDVGTAPLVGPLLLSAGRRRLAVQADGFVSIDDDITVTGRQPRTLSIRLAPSNEAGTLQITSSEPSQADLRIDGLDVGRAPISRELPRGGHVVEALAAGFQPYRAPIVLADRQHLDLHVALDLERPWQLYEQWWFWTAIAGGVALIAGVIILAVAVQPQEAPPIPGNSFQGVIDVLVER